MNSKPIEFLHKNIIVEFDTEDNISVRGVINTIEDDGTCIIDTEFGPQGIHISDIKNIYADV